MTKRDNHFQTYLADAQARTVRAQATAADQSLAEYVREAIEEKIERDGIEAKSERYRVEERILDLVDESAERAADKIVEELKQNDELSDEDNPYADWGE